jgi:hypothetical protein
MKICVFGAGTIGGHVAAQLAKGGANVSVVARGAQLAAIRDNGLTVTNDDETFNVAVAASDDPATLGHQDAVIVTVKAPALPSGRQRHRAAAGPGHAGGLRHERHTLVVFPRPRRSTGRPTAGEAGPRRSAVARRRPPERHMGRALFGLHRHRTGCHPGG